MCSVPVNTKNNAQIHDKSVRGTMNNAGLETQSMHVVVGGKCSISVEDLTLFFLASTLEFHLGLNCVGTVYHCTNTSYHTYNSVYLCSKETDKNLISHNIKKILLHSMTWIEVTLPTDNL